MANFDITMTGTVSGMWIAAPGTAIDDSSGLNGWLDCSTACLLTQSRTHGDSRKTGRPSSLGKKKKNKRNKDYKKKKKIKQ